MIGLISVQGWSDVARALGATGAGLIVIALFHFVPLAADTCALRLLVKRAHGIGYFRLGWVLWIGESINTLLPVASLGGEFVKTRLLMQRGVPGPEAGAYIVVNLTLSTLTQGLFALIGLVLLATHDRGDDDLALGAALGAGLLFVFAAAFWAAQRTGLFTRLAHLIERAAKGRAWLSLVGSAKALDDWVRALYAERANIAHSAFWQLASWLLGTGEIWLIFYFIGRRVSAGDAMLLESLGQTARSAGFIIPAQLGVQEGLFLLLAPVIGLGPDVALAAALARRVRDLALGLPGIAAWQFAEGRRLWGAIRHDDAR